MGTLPKSINAYKLNDWIKSKIENPIIIDVREHSELKISTFPHTDIHIPMSRVTTNYVLSKINEVKFRKFVVLCHMGIRSYSFGTWLLENKFVDEIWNLEEGIDGWSRYIDNKVQRY